MKRVTLPSGESVPALGQGTWKIGDDPNRRQEEIAAIRRGIDLGLTLIDTAEMYGDGRSETLVGEAIEGRRDEVFIASKVYPHNASRRAMAASCDNSLRRLRTGVIEWDLLPWLRERRIPVMAYSPLDEGRLLRTRALTAFAKRHAMTPAQAALAWVLAQDGVIAIPKTGSRERLEENALALEHPLTKEQLQELDTLFPPPAGPAPLEMI